MGNILLPGDPDFDKPILWGNAYAKTPKGAQSIRVEELDKQREKESNQSFKYASSVISSASDSWVKRGQFNGVNNVVTPPMWFSPLHTPQTLQTASRRREIYTWLNLPQTQVLMADDYTFKYIEDIIDPDSMSDRIEDTLTGGFLYESIKTKEIISGSGAPRSACKYGTRECVQKKSFEIKSYGYWRSNFCTEEHPMYVLDGKTHRRKVKQEKDAVYRARKGVKINRRNFHQLSDNLISRKEARHISEDDFLLAPIPDCGSASLDSHRSWLLGLYIADGSQNRTDGYRINFTMDLEEHHRNETENLLATVTTGKVSSRKHGTGRGWRVSATTKKCHQFFTSYVTGIKVNKKFLPKVFDLDKESRLHVLGGYFDGDGHFDLDNDDLILVANNCSVSMADQLYWLLLSVGIKISLGKHRRSEDGYSKPNSEWYYSLIIPSSEVPKLQPYMRSNKIPKDFIPKKERKFRFFYEENGKKYFAQPIQFIKQFEYTGPGYDIEIKPEHSFVANGYITSNCRFFATNECKVGAAIDFFSLFPMNGFKLQCTSEKVSEWFQHHVVKRLKLTKIFRQISREFFLLGDVFVHMNVDCPVCSGSSVDPETGEICNHPGGSFKRAMILNPDWIEVQQNIMADEPSIVMMPDEELKRIVFYKQPKEIYERIPDDIKIRVIKGMPIPLSNRVTSHLKNLDSPYGAYGESLIRRLFTTLAYKTKLMTANWIVAERLILPVRIVQVGSDDRPAVNADLADIQQQLAATNNDPNLTLITHHNVKYDYFGANSKIVPITEELEFVGKEMLDGLMLNQAILNGEGPTYSNANVGIEVLIRKIESWRQTLAEWCYENIFLPIAEMQGFIDHEKSEEIGETVYLYPEIKWNDLQLRDKSQWHNVLKELQQTQIISAQTLLEELGLDYDQEVKRMRYEQISVGPAGGMLGSGGAGMPGAGGPMGGGAGGMGTPPGMDGGSPMGPMGGGGMPGMPGGDMGGGMGGAGGMGGGAPGMGAAAGGGKITKKGKQGKQQEQEHIVMPMVKLTRIEQEMGNMLIDIASTLNLSYDNIRAQFPVQNPRGGKPFMIDFAMPKIKLAAECLHPKQIVQTKSGCKRACDISRDDLLLGRNGDYVNIDRIINREHSGKMVKIKSWGMHPILVTDNHPVLISKPKAGRIKRDKIHDWTRKYIVPDEPKFIDARDIQKGDFVLVPKIKTKKKTEISLSKYNIGQKTKHHTIPESILVTQDLAWLIGIYIAEGSSNPDSGNGIMFSFHTNELELISRTQYLLKSLFNLDSKVYIDEEQHSARVSTNSGALVKFLSENCGIHAINKKIPSFVFNFPNDAKLSLISAMSEGDGCIRTYDKAIRCISSSIKLLVDTQLLCASIGLFAPLMRSRSEGVYLIRGRTGKQNALYELVLHLNGHKKRQYREDDNYFYIPVKKISTEDYIGPVINFETHGEEESNHTFCAGNIITHNCDGEIFHNSPEQKENDQQRDFLLAQQGWTVLRFDDKTIKNSAHAVKQTISHFIQKLMQQPKKTASTNEKPIYLFMSKNGQLINLIGEQRYEKYFAGKNLYRVDIEPVPGGHPIRKDYDGLYR